MFTELARMLKQFEPRNRGKLVQQIEEDIKSGTKDKELSVTLLGAGMWDLSIAEMMVSKGVKLNVEFGNGETPILYACCHGYPQLVDLLIRNGVSVDSKDPSGETCLMKACVNGHEEVVNLLLRNNADSNLKDDEGQTALFYASLYGHFEIAQRLIETGKADINQPNEPGKAVVLAAYSQGHMKLGKYLASKSLKELQDKFNYGDSSRFKQVILASVDNDKLFPIKANHVLLVDLILELKIGSKKFVKLQENHKEEMMFLIRPNFKEKFEKDMISYLKSECKKLEKAFEKFMSEKFEVMFETFLGLTCTDKQKELNLNYSDIKDLIANNGFSSYVASKTNAKDKLERSMLLIKSVSSIIGNFKNLINMATHFNHGLKDEKFSVFLN